MGFLSDWDRIEVKVTSPDRSVRGTYTPATGMRVEFHAEALRRHGETSLVEQIKAVVDGLNQGNNRALRAVLEKHGTVFGGEPDPDTRRRDELFDKEVQAIEVAQASHSDTVRVRVTGNGELDMKIRPGSLGNLGMDGDKLANEVNTVLNDALNALGTRRQAIYRHVHGGEK